MNRFLRFRALTRSERTALFEALMLLPATALGLRVLGLRRLQSIAAGRASRTLAIRPADAKALDAAREIASIVDVAARHGIVWANCLQRSVVLWQMLRRRGMDSELRIGVLRSRGLQVPSFHAWVEWAGNVLNDQSNVRNRYVAFDRAIPPSGRHFD
jgi:hypothetical protein